MPTWSTTTISAIAPPTLESADACVAVIFGASGDLTHRKLIPALFRLVNAKCTPANFRVVGIGKDELTNEQFRRRLFEGATESKETGDFTDDEWISFASKLEYFSGDLTAASTYEALAAHLDKLRADGASANHLFYCSTPPSLAPAIVDGLAAAGLATEERGWSRVILEKPFGRDLESARELNARVARHFDEGQVYRIDHYLGKETVQNTLVFRFGNSMFEPVWNRNYIEYVEITASEPIGIGGRAGYYEESGALRDMVANHLLQLLTLTAMEPPVAFDADSVREEKVQVLRSIIPMTPAQVAERTVRGQYGPGIVDGAPVNGYREEEGVSPTSNTETYVAVQLFVQNWRWADVPFYLRAGKRLGRALTEINVHFKRTPHALFAREEDESVEPNIITLRIQPDEAIRITFGAKRPGTDMRTGSVQMDFDYSHGFGVRLPAAYETLLLDAMRGDATLFTRRDEVEAEWKLITPIEEAWSKQPPPEFPNYAAGSDGPAAADALLQRLGHRWHSLTRSTGTGTPALPAKGKTGVLSWRV